ncbi:unnamed protein product [Prorocentrum cordatum]|uniref:Aspartyl/asparaginy/proline hydroxylase domain-containing protein n=1 Tax=Prorocentrum cordatum TaxID=2364126 RepID=A0ABN9UTZ1_9DINO|nr:unnamed protein product [Polarella glacialis]
MNVNYVKLNPGAHLKPHFGNGPRLSAHLSVIAPEPLHAAMQVGTERVLWLEGKAIVFDDTYPEEPNHWESGRAAGVVLPPLRQRAPPRAGVPGLVTERGKREPRHAQASPGDRCRAILERSREPVDVRTDDFHNLRT